jgi:hypothetical protein
VICSLPAHEAFVSDFGMNNGSDRPERECKHRKSQWRNDASQKNGPTIIMRFHDHEVHILVDFHSATWIRRGTLTPKDRVTKIDELNWHAILSVPALCSSMFV